MAREYASTFFHLVFLTRLHYHDLMQSIDAWLRQKLLKMKRHAFLILTIGMLLAIPVFILFPNPEKKVSTPGIRQNTSVLFVTRTTPSSGQRAIPERITIEFSDPVDPDIFRPYFFISPEIQGTIQQGWEDNVIQFIPDEPFPEDYTISYRIPVGLPSKNGKTLQGDYVGTFITEHDNNVVRFEKNEMSGRVLSYANNKPVVVTISNMAAGDIRISLYKSTQAQFLNSLVYKTDANSQGIPNPYSAEFIRKSIPHTDPIESFAISRYTTDKEFNLSPDIYYIEAVQGKEVVGSTFIIVNSVGVVARQDDKKITLTTYDLAKNTLLSADASLGFYNMWNQPRQLSIHSYNGFERSYDFDLNQNLDLIIGTINNETVFIPFKLPQSMADIRATDLDNTYQLFIYTDRPIYKPGDTLKFSGLLRIDSDSQYKLAPAGKQIKVSITRTGGQSMIVTTNEHGAFSGELVLSDQETGVEYLSATTSIYDNEPGAYQYAYFEVEKYIKPEFEISTAVEKAEYLKNDKLRFTIQGSYFDGRPLKNVDIAYKIYAQEYYEVEKAVYNSNFNVTRLGGMCGGGFGMEDEYFGEALETVTSAKLDDSGSLIVEYTLPQTIASSKKITLVATKTDSAQNEIISAANTIVHASGYNTFFMPATQYFRPNEELVAPFYIESLEGKKLGNQEVNYTLLQTTYQDNKSVEKAFASGKTKTNDNGVGVVKLKLPEKISGSASLVVTNTDEHNNKGEARKYIIILKTDTNDTLSYWSENGDQTYLKITSSQNSFVVGDTIKLTIQSPAELDVLMSLERGRIYEPRVLRLFPGNNTVDLTVTEEMSPSVTVVFSFFADGIYRTEGLALNVPAMHKVLNVSVVADKKVYKPQETANLTIKTTNASGYPVAANLTLGVVDKAIFSLRKNATPPIHSAMYYFRSRSTNASSSLTPVGDYGLGGMGGGGGGGAGMSKVVDTLHWDPNLGTDNNGTASVSIPLQGFETTWKASVLGSTNMTEVGQGDTEFIVTSKDVQGVKSVRKSHH